MEVVKVTCSGCDLVFDVPPGAGNTIACPICDLPCPVAGTRKRQPKPASPKATAVMPAAAVAAALAASTTPARPRQPTSKKPIPRPKVGRMAAIVAVAALVTCLGVGLAAFVVIKATEKPAATPVTARTPDSTGPAAPVRETPQAVVPTPAPPASPPAPVVPPTPAPPPEPMPAPKREEKPVVPPMPVAPMPVAPKPVAPMPPAPKLPIPERPRPLTDDEIQVNRAVDRGVAYLKRYVGGRLDGVVKVQQEVGISLPGMDASEAALIGLALLECGLPADDKAVAQIAARIRADGKKLSFTYGLALAILFLDRLGDDDDQGLIETFALRLAAGQNNQGYWSYYCPVLTPAEEPKFAEYLKVNAYVVPDSRPAGVPRGLEKLPGRLKNAAVVGWQRGNPLGGGVDNMPAADNSNAQFALMGLWVAQRKGAPVQPCLAFVDRHFRATQLLDGGWNYGRLKPLTLNGQVVGIVVPSASNPSMTCAGLLGLAVGHGVFAQNAGGKKAAPDRSLTMGFQALNVQLGPWMNGVVPAPTNLHKYDREGYYLCWCIERVAMAYDLKAVTGREWYPMISRLLVKSQAKDGGWGRAPHKTCFALLVLRRANVAADLTQSLKASLGGVNLQMNPSASPGQEGP